jgi:hypothetical protein
VLIGDLASETGSSPAVNAEYLHKRPAHSEIHLIDSVRFVWEDAADSGARLQ